MFCVTSALAIFWQYLNHPNLLVHSVYRFHVCFHVRLTLHDLGISLPHEDGFSKVKNAYEDEHGVNPDETWMHENWSYTMDYGIFGHELKVTGRSPPDNLARYNRTVQELYKKQALKW